ncbi:MAG: VOC family protein [Gemmatimonadales bacterium]|jgi:glyoxalase family protein
MEQQLTGIHHVTAITGDPQRTLDFYSETLGLRLVKRTVNFDEPGTYRFYFGNQRGEPGTTLAAPKIVSRKPSSASAIPTGWRSS